MARSRPRPRPGGGTLLGSAANAGLTMLQLAPLRNYTRSTETGGAYSKGAGVVPVTFASTNSFQQLQYRLRDAESLATLADWTTLSTGATAGTYTLDVPVQARLGWYLVDLRANGDPAQVVLGTSPFGMGRVVAGGGQSLWVDCLTSAHDLSTTIASVGATVPNYCSQYCTFIDGARPGAGVTAVWARPTDGTDYNSAFAAEFLTREIETYGVNVSLVGHAVGASGIASWQPGAVNNLALRAILDAVGGFEAFIWFQGHTDAGSGMSFAAYQTALDTVFGDATARNARRGAQYQKLLCAIPNISSGSWGTALQRNVIRQAQLKWARANGGVYSQPMDIVLADGVHQTQVGALRLGTRFSRALAGQAVARPNLTLNAVTFGAAANAEFGQERTAGYGSTASTSDNLPAGATWTIECRASIASAPATTRVMAGIGSRVWIGIGTDGRLVANVANAASGEVYVGGGGATGGSSNPVISDGVSRHIALSVSTTEARLYVDGALIATAAVSAHPTSLGDSPFNAGTFGGASYGATYLWPGRVDEVAIWAEDRYTAAFTPPVAPYVGNEMGLMGLWHLDGNGAGLMAA